MLGRANTMPSTTTTSSSSCECCWIKHSFHHSYAAARTCFNYARDSLHFDRSKLVNSRLYTCSGLIKSISIFVFSSYCLLNTFFKRTCSPSLLVRFLIDMLHFVLSKVMKFVFAFYKMNASRLRDQFASLNRDPNIIRMLSDLMRL